MDRHLSTAPSQYGSKPGLLSKLLVLPLSIVLLSLGGCQDRHSNNQQADNIITVQATEAVKKLYYNTIIEPLTEIAVLSPLDANVARVQFNYGQLVKKGEVLLSINSAQLADDYRTKVADFLKSKQTLTNSATDLDSMKELHRAGVKSDQELQNSESTYQTNSLSFYQSKFELEKVLSKAQVNKGEIEQLALRNLTQVNQILNRQFSSIKIEAPVDGIVLFPTKQGGNDSAIGDLTVGDAVKENQRLLSIGDLSGFTLKIQISEINVAWVKVGQVATITGAAFPGVTLRGKVTAVATQAKPGEGQQGGLGMFDAMIKVTKLSAKAKKAIDVGMSAKVTLSIPEPAKIRIPIAAVSSDKTVKVVDQQGKQKQVSVVTGSTSLGDVVIVKGLSAGQRVVVPSLAKAANDDDENEDD